MPYHSHAYMRMRKPGNKQTHCERSARSAFVLLCSTALLGGSDFGKVAMAADAGRGTGSNAMFCCCGSDALNTVHEEKQEDTDVEGQDDTASVRSHASDVLKRAKRASIKTREVLSDGEKKANRFKNILRKVRPK